MRKFWFNLHLYGALISSIVIAILCVTGAIMAFEDEIDAGLNPSLFRVSPGESRKTIAELTQVVRSAYPNEMLIALNLPARADSSMLVFTRKKGGIRQVFLDPYLGKVIGERDQRTLLFRNHQLHTRLLSGAVGKTVVAIATMFCLFLTFSGIYLWWPLKRIAVKWRASARRVHFDLHHSAGILSALFATIVAVTGLVIGYEDSLMPVLYRWTHTPQQPRTKSVPPASGQAIPLSAEEAVKIASSMIPGALPHNLNFLTGPTAVYRVGLRFPEDLTPGGRSWVVLDQFSGKVLIMQSSRTAPAPARFQIVNRALHNGDIFGIPSKVAAALTCLAILAQVITGFYLWWKRTGRKNEDVDAGSLLQGAGTAAPSN